MSPEVLAAVLGVLGGVAIERVARSWGRLWCETSKCEVWYLQNLEWGSRTLDPEEAGDNWGAEYEIALDLFNGKEIPVGLREISVVISHASGELVSKPKDATSGKFNYGQTTYATLVTVNLPPRQWVRLDLGGPIAGGAKVAKGWQRIEFVGHRQRRGLLEPKTFRKTIASRAP